MAKRSKGKSKANEAEVVLADQAEPASDVAAEPVAEEAAEMETVSIENAQHTEEPFVDHAAELDASPDEELAQQLDAGVAMDEPDVREIDEIPDNVRDLFGADPIRAEGQDANPIDAAAEEDLDPELFELEEGVEALDGARLVSAIESLLFASDKLLSLGDLRRLTSVRETKKVQKALDDIRESRKDSGIILVEAAGSFRFKTNPANVVWVSRIIQGKPVRLGRAMMETLAIVAYKQPITRPEVDDVRGVDCGPVLRTLLDRNLVRVIGKKEDVGRPLLYGTTPEFLKTFNLSDLTELPTLREFHELGAEESAKMKKTFGEDSIPDSMSGERASAEGPEAAIAGEAEAAAAVAADAPGRSEGLRGDRPSAFSNNTVADIPEDESLIEELERATEAANRALGAGKSEPGAPVS
jgi:segregation and condensation protein B